MSKTVAMQTPKNEEAFDRAIAIVNGDLILDSDVDKELRFQELNLDNDPSTMLIEPSSSPTRSEIIERLINRQLILQQIRLQDESFVSDEDLIDQIHSLRQTIPACAQFKCETDSGWAKYLGTKGFTPASFLGYWREREDVLACIEERFRSGIRIDPRVVSDYYEKTLLPRYKSAKVAPPPLEKVSDRIESVLVEQQVSKLLNDWLQTLRAQGGVVILHPGQAAP